MSYPFADFVHTTMGAATNVADGSKLTPAQMDAVTRYLQSPGSGPTATTSFEDFVNQGMQAHPPELPSGVDYVAYAGRTNNKSNYENSTDYIADTNGKAGIIGNSPWGDFIENPANNASMQGMADKLQVFMDRQGIEPLHQNYKSALKDVMWNAGSEPFIAHGIESGRPLRGFVENATPDRGFTNFELPTALKSPNTIFNGYPMSAFTGDPVAFASKSAAELQQLEIHLAQSATVNSNRPISVADFRANVDVIGGYDAVDQTLFGRSVADFSAQNFDQMTVISKSWGTTQARGVEPRSIEIEAERSPVMEANRGTGPPRVNIDPLTVERAPLVSALGEAGPGVMAKSLGVAGGATLVYDGVTTTARASDLWNEGNRTGAQSQVEHFAGRTAGGLAGGFGAGFAYGALVGSETGPGAIATGLVGGAIGAFGGEKIAEWHDQRQIYNQTDPQGQTWNLDPKHEERGWSRNLPPLPETPHGQHFQAPPELAQRLTFQANSKAVELAMSRTGTPAHPYTQPANNADTPSFGDPPWQRNPETSQWQRPIAAPFVERQPMAEPRLETASPHRAAELDTAAINTIGHNLASSKRGIAEHYQAAYEQSGWSQFGAMPETVSSALHAPMNTLEASDGHTYSRNEGQWTTPGRIYGTNVAEGNIAHELDSTYAVQSAIESSRHAPAPAREITATPSPLFQELSAKIGRFAQAIETGDRVAVMKEVDHVFQSPSWQASEQKAQATATKEAAEREQQKAQLARDPRDAGHPDHAMNQSIRSQVERLHERAGVFISNKELDQLTASVANDARKQGMTRVDELHLSTDHNNLLAVQSNGPGDLFSKQSITNVPQAMQTPPEHAYHQMAQETQQQAINQQAMQQQITAQSQQQGPALGR